MRSALAACTASSRAMPVRRRSNRRQSDKLDTCRHLGEMLKVTGNPMSIAWYLAAVSLIGLVAMIAMRESAPVKLRTIAES